MHVTEDVLHWELVRTCECSLVGATAVLRDGLSDGCCIGLGRRSSRSKGGGQRGCCGVRVACMRSITTILDCAVKLSTVHTPLMPCNCRRQSPAECSGDRVFCMTCNISVPVLRNKQSWRPYVSPSTYTLN